VLAATAFFLGLAVVSSLWSVDPRLSAARAVSLILLFCVAASLTQACAGRSADIERVLRGLLGGAAAVAGAGLVVLAVDRADAVQAATYDLAARYQGLGENPNTASLLLALALPVALWSVLSAHSLPRRLGAIALVLLILGSIVASGSRGALVAAFVGVFLGVALAPLPLRGRAALAVCATALLAASVVVMEIPQPTGKAPHPPQGSAAAHRVSRYLDAEKILPLSFEIGSGVGAAPTNTRRLFGSSGRSLAWRGALDTAAERPALGYGFGTEAKVFVDRYALFAGGVPENSYIGLDLQLGAVGLAAFVVLVVTILLATVRVLTMPVVGVCLAVFLGGLTLAVVQSYVYSVGNIGTATVWICAFLGSGVTSRRPV